MDADRSSTFGAGPFNFFVPEELPDTMILNVLKVINHAHAVFCPVSFIQLVKWGAGVLVTFKTAIERTFY